MSKISVVIPVYNSSQTIGQCLKSVFAQTFKDLEVIAIDDGSTDSSWSALEKWQDRVKIYQQKNMGAPAARNFGFTKSHGDYVIFCDADVIMRNDMLQKMYDRLEANKNKAYAYSSFKFGWKTFKIWPFNLEKLKNGPYIPTTSLIRRNYFPGFDEFLKKFQDWDLWLTISENGGEGIWINEVLFVAKTGGTMSRWLPKLFYKLSWLSFVKKYNQAKKIIQDKHNLKS
ncbi:glycosyltransferase family 2 protein [Candidatus Falkowbacteria bacterium]|uniref:Glycosyltransferase 2-like domain-containing protein n=1 Tax=Candidatus Buchananbacteria bacterium CG10_big_fil_rev_8_21_14_0_10_33_19 TaxID=1974525 RepID=A0A2H0W3K9_9BACT|nr:glycosyltransferase family 2 protein [Candidatus Falkowbacteria bacterium]PIS05952.1 MAG: hypothetical protein COT80_04260 [Candidatus Buchananbacteria bacterium CG10_big_fil_rev_8_21_14_0_10_33_19]